MSSYNEPRTTSTPVRIATIAGLSVLAGITFALASIAIILQP